MEPVGQSRLFGMAFRITFTPAQIPAGNGVLVSSSLSFRGIFITKLRVKCGHAGWRSREAGLLFESAW